MKKIKPKAPRNPYVLSANSRVAGMAPMKDRRTPRGGTKNDQTELLKSLDEERCEDCVWKDNVLVCPCPIHEKE